MILQTGVIRLAVLSSVNGPKAKTLYLPPPAKDGLSLEWERKSTTKELVNGAERTRVLGYLPVLTCKWSLYDDRLGQGYTIGVADGQRPDLESLLAVLSNPTGLLKVSPGLAAGGFVVDSVAVHAIGKKGTYYTGIQVVFRGRDPLTTMSLGVF